MAKPKGRPSNFVLWLRKVFPNFFPDEVYESVLEIDPLEIKARWVFIDYSSTLSASLGFTPDDQHLEWLKELAKQHRVVIISDLLLIAQTEIIRLVAKMTNCKYYPCTFPEYKITGLPYRKAIERFCPHCVPEQLVMIGDGRIRDLWQAKRIGIRTIWINGLFPKANWLKIKIAQFWQALKNLLNKPILSPS